MRRTAWFWLGFLPVLALDVAGFVRLSLELPWWGWFLWVPGILLVALLWAPAADALAKRMAR